MSCAECLSVMSLCGMSNCDMSVKGMSVLDMSVCGMFVCQSINHLFTLRQRAKETRSKYERI